MNNNIKYENLFNEITTLEDLNKDLILEIVNKLSFKEKITLKIQGSVEIGNILMYGWKKRLPFYLFKCREHGYQINYLSGYYMSLYCLKCLHREAQNTESPSEPYVTDIKIEA